MVSSWAGLALTASVSCASEQMPARQTTIVSVPLNYAQYRGTDGRCVAFQQLPVALGKQCLPRIINKPKTHALASVSSCNWATCTVTKCSLIYFRRLVLGWTERNEVNGTGNSGGLIAKLYHSMSGNWPCHSGSAVTVLDMGYTSTMLLSSGYTEFCIYPYSSEKGT